MIARTLVPACVFVARAHLHKKGVPKPGLVPHYRAEQITIRDAHLGCMRDATMRTI